jgi:quercetin dioxygenase-like cupin family protein
VGFPVDNTREGDAADRTVGTTIPNGTVCRVIEFAPGVAPRTHRTDSVDYVFVLSGEIDMDLDGTIVHLAAGDVLVQRGTIHNWINRGTEPCVVAAVLVDAEPVEVAGRTLPAIG